MKTNSRITLAQCRKVYLLAFKKEMPCNMPYIDGFRLAEELIGRKRINSLINADYLINGRGNN